MSTPSASAGAGRATAAVRRLAARVGFRGVALLGVALVTASYASVLYRVADVVGDSRTFVLVVAGAFVLAVGLGRFLRLRSALVFTGVLLGGGAATYFLSLPESQLALLSAERLLRDTVALLTGLSILRLVAAGTWALAIVPGPVFLSWYLAVRRRYGASVAVGGGALGLVVLTGDAGTLTTLVGVVAGAGTVGAGALDRYGGSAVQMDTLAIVLAVMVLTTGTVSVIPGDSAQPLVPNRGSPTAEASLVNEDDSLEVLGSIRLSPEVRFTVESTEPAYWTTTVYDRYTGDGWVRTGDTVPYEGRLDAPPGSARPVYQRYTTKTEMSVLPAAWKPVALRSAGVDATTVTAQGTLRPAASIPANDSYVVESRVPQYTRAQLRRSGTDYPADVREDYLQLPDSTTPRVRQRAANVTEGASNPYDEAVAVERYLEAEKRYSLTVQKPSGDVADAFLFEMDAGYCTYYATTMVVMLRSEGVPARLVTGYTTGQQVAEDRYVVRGLDSHAWVEVYFADVGWVRFDPTPGGPRRDAEAQRLAEARQRSEPGVDTNETEPTPTPTPTVNESTPTPTPTENTTQTASNDSSSGAMAIRNTPTEGGGGGPSLPSLPPRDVLAFAAVALVGALATGHRVGATDRLYRVGWLRLQRPGDTPNATAAGAFARLEYLLGRLYRPRRPSEPPRAYLRSLVDEGRPFARDERAWRVLTAYERGRYGEGVDEATAAEAMAATGALVREATPIPLTRRRERREDGESAAESVDTGGPDTV